MSAENNRTKLSDLSTIQKAGIVILILTIVARIVVFFVSDEKTSVGNSASTSECQHVNFTAADAIGLGDVFSKEGNDLSELIRNGNWKVQSNRVGDICKFRMVVSGQVRGTSYNKILNFEKPFQ